MYKFAKYSTTAAAGNKAKQCTQQYILVTYTAVCRTCESVRITYFEYNYTLRTGSMYDFPYSRDDGEGSPCNKRQTNNSAAATSRLSRCCPQAAQQHSNSIIGHRCRS